MCLCSIKNHTSPPIPVIDIMAILEEVPNEILHEIISRLCPTDLVCTSTVSRHFQSISQAPLYRNPLLRVWGKKDTPLQLFLRTLLLSPDRQTLASYVRSLTVELEARTAPKPDSLDISLLTAAAISLGFNDHPLSAQGAQIVLLLRLLPRLNILDLWALDEGRGLGYTYFEDVLQPPLTLPLALQTIYEFRSVGTTSATGVTPMILVALMALPSIRKIVVAVTDEDIESEDFLTAAAAAAGTSRVTELHLLYGDLTHRSLGAILKIPQALTRFSYSTMVAHSYFELVEFGEALAPLRSSLQHMWIDFADTERLGDEDMDEDCYDTIGSLRGWEVLQTLDCPLMALLGRSRTAGSRRLSDMLPLGLHILRVVGDHYWTTGEVVDQVVGLLEQGGIPALQGLEVVFTGEVLAVGMKERLSRACERSHVLLIEDLVRGLVPGA